MRVTERLRHLEMIVSFTDYELHGFARGFDGRDEVTRLPLELRRFQRSVTDDDRSIEFIEMPLGA